MFSVNDFENNAGISWKQFNKKDFNQDHFYRIVSSKGYIDYLSNGVVRSSPEGTESAYVGRFNLGGRTTPFPSFSKSLPDLSYLKENDTNYIFETDMPMYKRGEEADTETEVRKIKGRHWAYRPIDKKTGKTITELKKDDLLAIYKINEAGELFVQALDKKEP